MLYAFRGHTPAADPTARVAENAAVTGQVTLGPKVSVWYSAVLRGDESTITVGEGSNIQDGVVVHGNETHSVRIGKHVTVGHRAVVHGCTVEDGCLIGIGAILLDGCTIGAGSLIAAGALVTQDAVIPPGSMVMGVPGRVVRTLTPADAEGIRHSTKLYQELAADELPAAGESL